MRPGELMGAASTAVKYGVEGLRWDALADVFAWIGAVKDSAGAVDGEGALREAPEGEGDAGLRNPLTGSVERSCEIAGRESVGGGVSAFAKEEERG